jgi:uncharacterized membrane protein
VDSGITAAIIGVIGTLLGSVIGFGSAWLQEKSKTKRQAKGTRTMIILEINHNIRMLREYYVEVTEFTFLENTRKLEPREIASAAAEARPPNWSHKIWESQLHFLPVALSENEIKMVHEFHSGLNLVTAIQEEAAKREPKRQEQSKQLEKGKPFEDKELLSDAMLTTMTMYQLGEKLKQVMDTLLKQGNPLIDEFKFLNQGTR